MAAATIGVGLSAWSIAYAAKPPDVVVAAQNCHDAPAGCVVQVSGSAPPAVVIAGLLIGALFLLIAVTGTMFRMSLPGGGSLEPVATPVTRKPADLEDLTTGGPASGEPPRRGAGGSERYGTELWLSLPPSVRGAAEDLWFDMAPSTSTAPSQALIQVEREPGKGPTPYYLTFHTDDGEELIIKVAFSDRAKVALRS